MADRSGFEGYYSENLARVVRACTLVLLDRSAAEDVASEAFARLWSHWGTIQGPDHAGGYVFKTAMRLCSREAKRVARRMPAVGDSADEMEAALTRQEIGRALAALPLRQRQCVVLRDWAGADTAEVARMLGMRESTVRVHLARGREALRRSLTPEEMN